MADLSLKNIHMNNNIYNLHQIFLVSCIMTIFCRISAQRNPLSAISLWLLLLLSCPHFRVLDSSGNASMYGSVCCVFVVILYVCSTNNYAEDDEAAIMIIDNVEHNDEVLVVTACCVKSI